VDIINNIKISDRLAAVFFIVTVVMVALVAFSVNRLHVVNYQSKIIHETWLPRMELLGELNTATSGFYIAEQGHVLNTDKTKMAEYEKSMNALFARIESSAARFNKLIASDVERRIFEDFQKDWKSYLEQHEIILFLSRANRNEEARDLLQHVSNALYVKTGAELNKLAELNKQGANNASNTGVVIIDQSRKTILAGLFIAIVFVVATAFAVIRSINRPMQVTIEALDRFSKGDFTESIQITSQDEAGQILSLMQVLQKNIAQILSDFTASAQIVSSGSAQVAQRNTNLSKRTQEHGSNLQVVASSMEELLNTVNQNADNAQMANQLAMASYEQADKGGAVVGRAVSAMAEINQSSKRIADIIGVIDEIAFQTNLLALNAAVEAARAGEQGRGFAAVASEVRRLAGRSATAAKEIKSLIQDSVAKVEEGSRLVNKSGKTLEEIVVSVKSVTDIVAEIAAASQEQSLGIAQVNKAILQMDEMTQQHAALVEEAAAAAESMDAQAQQLHALAEYFKLNSGNKQMLIANECVDYHGSHADKPHLAAA
jgi:methyl-accepting chemotaxis protein